MPPIESEDMVAVTMAIASVDVAPTDARDAEALSPAATKASAKPGTPEFAAESRALDSRPMGYRVVKRSFDIVFSACVCAVGLIPGAALCALIAADTKGAPIYAHERAGRYGRPIKVLKFRSMVADADDVEKYLTPDQLAEWHRERKVTGDPRITKLGRILRRTSLDELPQFVNVLLGQMSVVGPRPVVTEELAGFTDADCAELLSVRPGVTGWWQVTERNDATWESGERQNLELFYVRNASARLDVEVLRRTFSVMFGKRKTGR